MISEFNDRGFDCCRTTHH